MRAGRRQDEEAVLRRGAQRPRRPGQGEGHRRKVSIFPLSTFFILIIDP